MIPCEVQCHAAANITRTTGDVSGDISRSAATGDLDLSLAGDLDLDLSRAGEADRSLDTDRAAS